MPVNESAILNDLAQTALVVIGRGTSQIQARESMRQFVELRAEHFQHAWSITGFFVGDETTVEVAIDQAAQQSVADTIIVQPHLLFEGLLSQQLRDLVQHAMTTYPNKRWLVAMPLGADVSLAQAWGQIIDEKLQSII